MNGWTVFIDVIPHGYAVGDPELRRAPRAGVAAAPGPAAGWAAAIEAVWRDQGAPEWPT